MKLQESQTDPLFEHFDSEEHRLWKRDRVLRQKIPMRHVWRGCLGLAILLHDVERTEYPTDHHALVPNETMTWLALRDIPRNHFPAVPAMNRREVQYVNTAQATLRYGMPVLDFTEQVRDAWDLRFMPFGRYQRTSNASVADTLFGCGDVLNSDDRPLEFAVLNRLNSSMTRYAFAALDARGRAMHQAWAKLRPNGLATFTPQPVSQWMPRPYLAFDARHEKALTPYAETAALRLDSQPNRILFAAQRVDQIAHIFRPLSLWWDLQPSIRYIDGDLAAAILPPIPLAKWNGLRFRLPGEVLLNACIADPRFSATPIRSVPIQRKSFCELAAPRETISFSRSNCAA